MVASGILRCRRLRHDSGAHFPGHGTKTAFEPLIRRNLDARHPSPRTQPENQTMNSMPSVTPVDDRPKGIPWSEMPTWFHVATFVYFATNVFGGWAALHLGVPTAASAFLAFGLVGGFSEHISPYFPRLFIPVFWEKLLFRVPTIIGYVWVAISMGLSWFFIVPVLVHAIVFIRQSALTSMEFRYHIKHLLATHISGAVGMLALLAIASGKCPALNALVLR